MREKASKELLRKLKRDYDQCESDLLYSAIGKLPGAIAFYTVGLLWDCKESPFGLCVYHIMEDPAHDQCVFCSQPAERK